MVRSFVCKRCGKVFEREHGVGMYPRYCSDACSKKYHHPECVCQHCGKTFRPKETNRTTYCSRECQFAHRHDRAEQRKADREAGIGACCRVYFVKCAQCGKVFTTPHIRRTCSPHCQYALAAQRKHPLVTRPCLCCGQEFTYRRFNLEQLFCSRRCSRRFWRQQNPALYAKQKATQRHVRRARKLNLPTENIKPVDVYERDRWLCGICGQSVDAALRFPDPMSASLDHIKPLALGGSHTWDNVQLAHLVCNTLKGAKQADEGT